MSIKKRYIVFLSFIFCSYTMAYSQSKKDLISLIKQGDIDVVNSALRDTIPIEKSDNWIVLKLKVNGKEQKFIWDTGTAYSSISKIDSNFKKVTNNEIEFTDVIGESTSAPLYTAKHISIGKINFNEIAFMMLDTEKIAGGLLKDFGGLIGLNIIDKINWNFNFDENYVVISQEPFNKNEGKVLKYANFIGYNTLKVNIKLSNGKSLNTNALIDFGIPSGSLYLSHNILKDFKGYNAIVTHGSGVGVTGVGKPEKTYILADSIMCTFGPRGRNLSLKTQIVIGSTNEISVIGNNFFRKFNFIRNSTESIFILLPRTTKLDTKDPNLMSYGISFNINEDKEIYVLSLDPSLCHKIKINQLVKSVNNKNASAFHSMNDIQKYLDNLMANESQLELVMENGNTFNLKPRHNNLIETIAPL